MSQETISAIGFIPTVQSKYYTTPFIFHTCTRHITIHHQYGSAQLSSQDKSTVTFSKRKNFHQRQNIALQIRKHMSYDKYHATYVIFHISVPCCIVA